MITLLIIAWIMIGIFSCFFSLYISNKMLHEDIMVSDLIRHIFVIIFGPIYLLACIVVFLIIKSEGRMGKYLDKTVIKGK